MSAHSSSSSAAGHRLDRPPAVALARLAAGGGRRRNRRRATILLMIVGLLAMLFVIVSTYIVLARFDRQTQNLAARGGRVAEVANSVQDLAIGMIRGAGRSDLVSGVGYTDIPGGGLDPGTKLNDPSDDQPLGATWLAAAEPVRDARITNANDPNAYLFPATTGVEGRAVGQRLPELMLDRSDDKDIRSQGFVLLDFADPFGSDLALNARSAFMDADGDGMPDTLFPAAALATELANAVSGRPVSATGLRPNSLDPTDPNVFNYLMWTQQIEQGAQYLTGLRIVSHGGMVQIGHRDPCSPFAQFSAQMFNWILHPDEQARPLDLTIQKNRDLIEQMAYAAQAVEPLLRRRGGLIAEEQFDKSAPIPAALWNFMDSKQGGWPWTLSPRLAYTGTPMTDARRASTHWQRFNLADANEWRAWQYAALLDADQYNSPATRARRLRAYVRRPLLTTLNSSDELARIVTEKPKDPNAWDGTGLLPGQAKFYLGRITDPTLEANGVARGAFDPRTYTFNNTSPLPGRTLAQGAALVAEITRYFDEMLSGHKSSAFGTFSRGEQAAMLAVNTVAFAAPRDPRNGVIDAVYDVYEADGFGEYKAFIGYAPQLFLTQAVAYTKTFDPNDPNSPRDPNDPNSPADPNDPRVWRTTLAIELYYPHDPSDWNTPKLRSDGAADPSALDLRQYLLTVNSESIALNVVDLGAEFVSTPRLQGRNFLTLTLRDATGPPDLDGMDKDVLLSKFRIRTLAPIANDPNLPRRIHIRLWRKNVDETLIYVVDELILRVGDQPNGEVSNGEWLANNYRDTNGTDRGSPGEASGLSQYGGARTARWRMVTGQTNFNDIVTGVSNVAVELPRRRNALGNAFSIDTDVWPPLMAPFTPLPTMNAPLRQTVIPPTQVARPASFPTPGFLLFVPRLTHVVQASGVRFKPITRLMLEEWVRWAKDNNLDPNDPNATLPSTPADFGHMAVFSNDPNNVEKSGPFDDSRLGSVPWGLLVFDYFTTINPEDANGDGATGDFLDIYRVPGRININTAPWYVLAGLPVIGAPNQLTNLPLDTGASPEFWSWRSGVLTGEAPFLVGGVRLRRFLGHNGAGNYNVTYDPAAGTWRLGPELAQVAAAYRDRAPYVSTSGKPTFRAAASRNDPPQYRPAAYGKIRSTSNASDPNNPAYQHYGFLTVGELANVVGFDSSLDAELNTGPSSTALGKKDFIRAVSLLALLDTHYLTTRSNVFTIYATLADQKNPQASIRSQVTIDRSNLLPRLIWQDRNRNGLLDRNDAHTIIQNQGQPEVIGERQVSYFNARFDE